MRAIRVVGEGRAARLEIGTAPVPEPGPGEVAIAVHATAVNRADLLQSRGLYPPPPGASEILGLECSGTVEGASDEVTGLEVGMRVMALLPGGGYAERVTVDAGSVFPIPEGMSFAEAAAIPEVFLTCYLNLFEIGRLAAGDAALVHGGGSGIGTAAIALLGRVGVRTLVTAGSESKCRRCESLGAELALNYRDGAFAEAVLAATDGEGVDLVLDSIGAPYLAQHLQCLRTGGRLIQIGLMGGAKAELHLGLVVSKRLAIIGSTLRARSVAAKAELVRSFRERFGSDLERGEIVPVIDCILPLESAQEAHELLDRSDHFGKVVLEVRTQK
ncbi:MAG: NAD(P)H-quinone oxidoreductase [Myxococcales bacterium]|nr:NAD(P)H-quinone oxidoreductase [Myxococcales bacterium]